MRGASRTAGLLRLRDTGYGPRATILQYSPRAFTLHFLEFAMTKKHAAVQSPIAEPGPSPEPQKSEPHHDVTSTTFDHANDRMKLAAEPNDGQPLAHRDRGKAGRKG